MIFCSTMEFDEFVSLNFWIMRNSFASCNTYTFQMFQIKENPPILFTFSFSFPTGKLNQHRTFICQICFHLKIRYLLTTLFLLSHSWRISQIIRALTYAYNLCSVLKWEKTLSIFRFLIMFPLNSLSVCLFHVHGLPTVCALKCPHYIKYSCTAAVRHHRPQLLYAAETTADAAIVINPSRLL